MSRRSIYTSPLQVHVPFHALLSFILKFHTRSLVDIMDADAPFIALDADNTVDSLSRKLTKLYNEGSGSGFPILGQEKGGLRMFG